MSLMVGQMEGPGRNYLFFPLGAYSPHVIWRTCGGTRVYLTFCVSSFKLHRSPSQTTVTGTRSPSIYIELATLDLCARRFFLLLGRSLTAYSILKISQAPEPDLMAPVSTVEETLECLATKLDGMADGNLGQELRRLLQDETTLDDVCFRCLRKCLR
jgi:hypothetical protein